MGWGFAKWRESGQRRSFVSVTRTIGFDELPAAFDGYIKNQIQGRTVVKIA